MQILSEQLKRRLSLSNKRSFNEKDLAQFITLVEEDEELLVRRAKDNENRVVINAVNGEKAENVILFPINDNREDRIKAKVEEIQKSWKGYKYEE